MNIDFIDTKDFLEIYKEENLETFGTNLGIDTNRSLLRSSVASQDKIIVTKLVSAGPYSVVEISHVSGNRRLIVPSNIIKTQSLPSAFDAFAPILDQFHKDHWTYVRRESRQKYVIIHYPKLTITNTVGGSHEITDLVVRFILTEDYKILNLLEGARLTVNMLEWSNGYLHSHLHISNWGFSAFCRGGGSPVDVMLASMSKFNTEEQFSFFLTQLKLFLEWESVEGNPYISISALRNNRSVNLNGVIIDIPQLRALESLAKAVVKNLARPENHDKLSRFGRYYAFPGYYPTECSMINSLPEFNHPNLDAVRFRYDNATNAYYHVQENSASMNTSNQTRQLEDLINAHNSLIDCCTQFKVTPKVYPNPNSNTIGSTLPFRLVPRVLSILYKEINKLLANGLKHINTNERIESSRESERDNNKTVSFTSSSFA